MSAPAIPRFRCISHSASNAFNLICFPHAGASASFFQSWSDAVADCDVYAVCYPGRAERIAEPNPVDLINLATDIAQDFNQLNSKPLVFFVHSLGAPLAFEVARILEAKGKVLSHLFASGSRLGPLPPKSNYVAEDDDTICKQLINMGGTTAE